MRKILFSTLFLSVISLSTLNAQNIKTSVLVVGDGSSAWAAGLQAAVSGVKTTILTQGPDFKVTNPVLNLHSGIELEFLNRMKAIKKVEISTLAFDQKTANLILKQWGDTVKKPDGDAQCTL
jgi:cation diffusion facilitator CzcD-associated flavoprotein CzcO